MDKTALPLVIGIAGGSGSGKTTLAQSILDAIGRDRIAFLPHDAYYRDQTQLSFEERLKVNYDHPDALETDLLIRHILALKAGKVIERPVYDFKLYTRASEIMLIEPRQIIMVEGILLFYEPQLRKLFDMKVYVDADPDICFIRRLTRDIEERGRSVESVVQQYLSTVRPSYIEFVEPSKRFADIIIPEGGKNTVALNMVIARLQGLLDDANKLTS
ncbi:MAG: uridine kinase [Chloroflexi bacterium]|jgi:uridine kinase|nr:uridine kinase [Anaerolineaceae bacterium]NLI44624.1 uridine kinase [Chloroflexota bacterium]HOE35079.1 uridine kinase [Anaerolineaceae bacterium]HOT25711.1 uridine kinase [Anaerolineaceae bacterium]HQH57891.1 uridine kinase [Anaerolineaceae bacterium]